MSIEAIVPKRAQLDCGALLFEGSSGFADALADGCFMLRVPPDISMSSGIALARNFYRERDGNAEDANRGFRTCDDIYFDREHFQTEHLLLDKEQRSRYLQPEVVALCDELCVIGRAVLEAILKSLVVPQEVWSRATVGCLDGRAIEWMAVSHYRSDRRQPGCPAHKDTGFVTVLYFEKEGLEAWSNGRWKRIDPVPGYLLINFGGALELLTHKLHRPVEALLHRVVECRPDSCVDDRFSFAAFINPPASGDLCELDTQGNLHHVQSVEDFLRAFNEDTWRDSYTDFGITQQDSKQKLAAASPK